MTYNQIQKRLDNISSLNLSSKAKEELRKRVNDKAYPSFLNHTLIQNQNQNASR